MDSLLIVGVTILGIVVAGWVAGLVSLAYNRSRPAPARALARPTARVVAGPTQADGRWLRLIEMDGGHRRLEVLGPQGWVSTDQTLPEQVGVAVSLPTSRPAR